MDNSCVTVNAPVSYKKFQIPNFAIIALPPRSREEGMKELPSVPLSQVPNQAFVALVEAWVSEMYTQHGQQRPSEVVAQR